MKNRSVLYELNIDLSSNSWGIDCPLDQTLVGPVQYGWHKFKDDPNCLTFGGGLLAGSPLAGTRRMIFCGYSPQWEGFYISALGGAMYVMHRTGVNYVCLRGRAKTPSVIVFRHYNGDYSLSIEPIRPGRFWRGFQDNEGRARLGFYGLQQHLFEKYKTLFPDSYWRILTVGPAARFTNFGAIGSSQIKNGELSAIDDWAGRGGLGSRLYQYHRIAGFIFGGDWQDPALKEGKQLDQYFLEHFGQTALKTDLALSEKYRYVPKFDTGGTFGVNMHEAEDRLFSFNYQSVYHSYQERLEQNQNFIRDHYLQQFNEEIIEPRNFAHCGEPCSIACKKYFGPYRKDFEPYQALGPNLGIFDQRAAELVNEAVDSAGLDAIQTGGLLSWLMEVFYKEILDPGVFHLEIAKPVFKFSGSLKGFNLVSDSMKNARIALALLDMILNRKEGKIFSKGIRQAAKAIDRKHKKNTLALAVYNAHGKGGCMVPNQYWTPGMFSPMPIMGKYFSYYGNEFIPPEELGKKNVERFIYELYSENSGSCRFHRKWVEEIIDEIILSHFDLHFDYWKMSFHLVKEIIEYQAGLSVPWETQRTRDIIQQFLVRWKERGLKNSDLEHWIARFEENQNTAALEFWVRLQDGMLNAIQDYFTEPGHSANSNFK